MKINIRPQVATTTVLAGLLLLGAMSVPAQTTGGTSTIPVISIGASDPSAKETGDPGRFVLNRLGSTNDTVHVFLSIGGSAANGVDYVPIHNWIPIPAGVREVPLPVNPIMDTTAEGPEIVVIRLVPPPVVPPVNYLIGPHSNAVVTIFEGTNPPPHLPVVIVRTVDAEAAEPSASTPPNVGVFRVWRDGNTNDELHVRYTLRGTASNGVDYVFLHNVTVIPAGGRSADVVVVPQHDRLPEGMETVNLRLVDVAAITVFPPPAGSYLVGTPREAMLGIADNDQPTNHPPLARILRPFDGQMFHAPVNVPIVVDTMDPDGFVPRVEFFANDIKIGVREKRFLTPPPSGEHIGYDLIWSNAPVGRHVLTARATDNNGAPGWAMPVGIWVVNTNPPPPHTNLEPRVTITAADPIAAEGTNCVRWSGTNHTSTNIGRINPALFVVRRTGPTNEPMTVYYRVGGTASNGVDYLELPGTVTIPAGRRGAEIRVIPIDDAVPELDETVIVGLGLPPRASSLVPPYYVSWPGRAGAVIVDDDRPRPGTGMVGEKSFHFTMPGANGQWFRIECSSDAVHWTPITTLMVVDGAIHFVDPESDEVPNRLYRAVPELNPPLDQ